MADDRVKRYLVLEDGSVFEGWSFGADAGAAGEVVFSTSMTGYQEMLTDPSFAGQIVVPTYPMIGNYGINGRDSESARIRVAGFVVRDHCDQPSHADSEMTVDEFLRSQNIPGLWGIDTRALTRRLRTRGVMMGALGSSAEAAAEQLQSAATYGETDLVQAVTTGHSYHWTESDGDHQNPNPNFNSGQRHRVLVSDFGVKYNIMRLLQSRGCEVITFPATASAQELLQQEPDGILLSPGPGDPELLDYAVETAKGIVGKVPVFGICLGNQVLARAFGGRTYKLKFGHRGANHPVKDLRTGRAYITAQNHGYAVDADSLPSDVTVSHVSLNDGTVEGMRHREMPVMSIQYHSEASPGPRDSEYIFDDFVTLMDQGMNEAKSN
jgi:carbamoyl-phosphate synthase small subunit